MVFDRAKQLWQTSRGCHYPRIKRRPTPFIKRELRSARQNLSRDLAAQVIAFLDHVLGIPGWVWIAFASKKKRSGVAVLHPSCFRIGELRQLLHGVIPLPLGRRITSVYGLSPIKTRIATRHGAIVDVERVALTVGIHNVAEEHVERS